MKKQATIIESKNLNAAFKSIKNETLNLKPTLRAILEIAAINKDAKQIANWLDLTDQKLTAKNFNEYRANLVSNFVYYTETESGVKPCTLSTAIIIDNVSYFSASQTTYLNALRQIAIRKNKQLEAKHIEVKTGAYYDKDLNVITDAETLAKIDEALKAKEIATAEKRAESAAAKVENLKGKASE